jgi:hypothetical protein
MAYPSWLPRLLDLGTIGLALGLFGLAVHATVLPLDAAATYGVPTEGSGEVWVRAAGLRDAVLGFVVLATLRHRAARSLILGAALLLPLADVVLALGHAGAAATLPHVGGVLGIGVLVGASVVVDR